MNQISINAIMNTAQEAAEVARIVGVPIADVRALRRVVSKIGKQKLYSIIVKTEKPATVLAECHSLRESDIRAIRNLAGLGRRRVEVAVVSLRIRNDLALKVTTPIRRHLQQLVEKELASIHVTKE